MTSSASDAESGPPSGAQPAYYTFSQKLAALESPPKSPAAVAIHEMAAQLIAQQADRGRRGVAVCGPSVGVGSSLLCANLAIAMAQAGIAVLLVDADLHSPALETIIAPSEPALGLQQVLRSSDLTLDDVVHSDILPGLSVLYAGGPCSDASELIGGPRCGELLTDVLRHYDYAFIDTPPANRSTDGRNLASTVGYGLIVARRNRTYVDDVSTLHGELEESRAQVIGTVYVDS